MGYNSSRLCASVFRSRSAFDFYTPTVPSRDRDTKTKRVNIVNADYIDERGDIQTCVATRFIPRFVLMFPRNGSNISGDGRGMLWKLIDTNSVTQTTGGGREESRRTRACRAMISEY